MRATYFGHSCWGHEMGDQRLLIDPYPTDDAAEQAIRDYARGCGYVLATHGAADHLGLGFELVRDNENCTLVTEPAVVRAARLAGLADDRTLVIFWNAERVLGSLHVRAIETRHISAFATDEAGYSTGMPLAFVVWDESEPDMRVLHLGDTSLFSDLALLGQLYRPVVAFVGVGAARGFLAEMTPQEAALACFWLGVDVGLPMHFEADPQPAEDFCAAITGMPASIDTWVPQTLDSFTIARQTTIQRPRA